MGTFGDFGELRQWFYSESPWFLVPKSHHPGYEKLPFSSPIDKVFKETVSRGSIIDIYLSYKHFG